MQFRYSAAGFKTGMDGTGKENPFGGKEGGVHILQRFSSMSSREAAVLKVGEGEGEGEAQRERERPTVANLVHVEEAHRNLATNSALLQY